MDLYRWSIEDITMLLILLALFHVFFDVLNHGRQEIPCRYNLLAKARALRWFPHIPSCTYKRTYTTSSFPRNFSNGIDKPLLYKVPPIIVYLLALLFTKVALDGSDRRLTISIYSCIRDIQDGETVQYMSNIVSLGGFNSWGFIGLLEERVINYEAHYVV